MNIIDCIHDPNLFRPFFKEPKTWQPWFVVLKAIFGLPMNEEEVTLFKQLTGRTTPPSEQVEECWLIVGRRGGKSFITALIAVYLAFFRDYRQYLAPGERGTLMVLAVDRRQARTIMRYISGLIEHVPMLTNMVDRQDSQSIDLNNKITIEIHTASYRAVRGYTCVGALLDEVAFWRSEESVNPDIEIINALRPAMSTIPGAMLIGLGTPYRRSGVLYDVHRRHYGQDHSPILVVQAETRTMNPSVPQSVIDRAFEMDPANASAEYLAQFRSDVGSFLDFDLIDRAVETGRRERLPLNDCRYVAFTDPSGGAHDSFTLAIAHIEKDQAVLDVCRGIKPPFNPSSVVTEYAGLLVQYRCSTVIGDRYAGQWVVESFAQHGIRYRHSERNKWE